MTHMAYFYTALGFNASSLCWSCG